MTPVGVTRTSGVWAWAVCGVVFALAGLAVYWDLDRPSYPGVTDLARDLPWFISFLVFAIVGAVIASRRPENRVGWLFLVVGGSMTISSFCTEYAARALLADPGSLPGGGVLAWVSLWTWVPAMTLFPLMIAWFPSGKLPSRRLLPIAAFSVASTVLLMLAGIIVWRYRGVVLLSDEEVLSGPVAESLGIKIISIVFPLVLLAVIVALLDFLFRFRRSRGEEREQFKWVAYAAALALLNLVLTEFLFRLVGFDNRIVIGALEFLGMPGFFAIAVGVAILRYRLYDIDVIINRTLVYVSLTAFLGFAYAALVVALNTLVGAFGSGNNLAVAASTLAVAALFTPARRAIQQFIDRRFYRTKYDAEQTLAGFSERVRDELDIKALASELVGVVHHTMQPAQVSLWLMRPAQ